jgi:hypothetical protein
MIAIVQSIMLHLLRCYLGLGGLVCPPLDLQYLVVRYVLLGYADYCSNDSALPIGISVHGFVVVVFRIASNSGYD